MGSYGTGVSRLVGAIIEASHDANGIVWPEPVAPFKVGLVNIRTGDATCERACEDIFTRLRDAGVELLYDDRPERAGIKFAEMELIGLTWQLVVGPKGLEKGVVELKNRRSGERDEVPLESARSEERRVGKEWVSRWRSRGLAYTTKTNKTKYDD